MQNTKNSKAGNLLPKVFSYSTNQPIRVEIFNDETYFVAKDICDILGLDNVNMALGKLDNDEKLMSKVLISGQLRNMVFVNESGLYNLIFRSYKPEAKAFRKWVTTEVLPSLRKEGSFTVLPKMECRWFNDVKMFHYHAMARCMGYSTGGSLYERTKRYPGQFVKVDGLMYVSEAMARLMALTRGMMNMRRSVKALPPVLTPPEELPQLPFGIDIDKLGGYAI
jgi:hypothetical protein